LLDALMASKSNGNSILDSLPPKEFGKIFRDLESVPLAKDSAILRAGRRNEYTYFPTDAVISFLGDTRGGGSIEVWSVGHEGAAGVAGLLGHSTLFPGVVVVGGTALRAKAATLRKHFEKSDAFHKATLGYLQYLMTQISYLGICNNSHPLDQRLSRWLLVMEERVGSNVLNFTQGSIAGVLGTRRATISVAAAKLQADGLIRYTPGAITICSRRGLRKVACSCYKVINLKLA
jgi:CRP-like cAMP-binding protein